MKFSGFKNFPEDRAKLVTTTVIYTLNTYQNYMFFVLSTYVFAYLYRKLPPQWALNCCNPKCSQIGMKWDSLFEALFYFSVLLWHHHHIPPRKIEFYRREVSWTLFKIFLNHDFLEFEVFKKGIKLKIIQINR